MSNRVVIRSPSGRDQSKASYPGDLFYNPETNELFYIKLLQAEGIEFRVFDKETLEESTSIEISGRKNIAELLSKLIPICGLESFDISNYLIKQLTKRIERDAIEGQEIKALLNVIVKTVGLSPAADTKTLLLHLERLVKK